MSKVIATDKFHTTVNYLDLSIDELYENINTTKEAFKHFYSLWQDAINNYFGEEKATTYTARIYPTLGQHHGNLDCVFLDDLNFIWKIISHAPQLLTFGTLENNTLPRLLTDKNTTSIASKNDLVLLWNLCTLTYVMQTSRWVETLYQESTPEIALKLGHL